jgi:tricarballylate dehydrogenase
MRGISVVAADSIDELGHALGIDAEQFARTVAEFNASIDTSTPFELAVARDVQPSDEP